METSGECGSGRSFISVSTQSPRERTVKVIPLEEQPSPNWRPVDRATLLVNLYSSPVRAISSEEASTPAEHRLTGIRV
ncbi:hypothetical protein J5N97_017123 [Dioscorea zingiberensis]|uniref:Uncharacterized protein n=1 Tax=Dioscorea zingiberensis TaxID=325984 RepID=A0A9D5CMN9_9LILI|nr:hypothetical protein J5N97_017123 [Dioscorea zingiberensis]